MALAVQSKPGSLGASHNAVDFATHYVSPLSYNNAPISTRRSASNKKLSPLTSTKSLGNVSAAAGSPGSLKSSKQHRSQAGLRHIDTDMTSYTNTTTIPGSNSHTGSRLTKLHKRASSGASLPATPSPLSANQSQVTTPYTATYEESRPSISSQTSSSTAFKSRPYIRKLSSAKDTKHDENQGRLDLSKSTSEIGYMSGLGIQDYDARTASEVTFSHTSRRAAHARTTSGGSQVSVSSRSFTPTQPFIHPMRPNPYTPSGQSYASSMNDEEAHESSDIVTEDDISIGPNFRTRRSASISSTPQIQPTPLSQAYSAADLGIVPKYNTSQSNISIKSGRSAKSSSRSKLTRPRRNTDRSDQRNASSHRNSIDKAVSIVSRRSDTDPRSRDERIQEKRRQFNEKEANKDRRQEMSQIKRRETNESREERQRRKSEASQSGRPSTSQSGNKIKSLRKVRKPDEKRSEELKGRSYDDTRPAPLTALPNQAMISEKGKRAQRESKGSSGTWPRFSTWLQTRLLSCGGKG